VCIQHAQLSAHRSTESGRKDTGGSDWGKKHNLKTGTSGRGVNVGKGMRQKYIGYREEKNVLMGYQVKRKEFQSKRGPREDQKGIGDYPGRGELPRSK